MKKYLPFLLPAPLLFLTIINALAQAPSISYSPSTNTYTKNVTISQLTPTSSGSAVPATIYGTVTTLAAGGSLNSPRGLAADGSGNVYETNTATNQIYMVNSSGTTTLIAGSGIAGESNSASGSSAQFNGVWGVAYNSAGYIYVCDYSGSTIRKISTTAPYAVTTLAGTSGNQFELDGISSIAAFNRPSGIVFDGSSYLYVCDYGGNTIRKVNVSTGTVTTIAGLSAAPGEVDNTTGTSARFNGPRGITYDNTGYLYVTDNGGNTVRKISTTAPYAVTTLVNSAAGLSSPEGITVSGHVLYVADRGTNRIKRVFTTGSIANFAGDGVQNELDATGTNAEFYSPYAINASAGNLYVGDSKAAQSTIRKIIATGYTISPALSAGLGFNPTTGVIQGTPTTTFSSTVYTVMAYNATGATFATLTLSCQANNLRPNINYSPSSYVLTLNTAISPAITPTNTGGAVPSKVYGTVTTFVPASSPLYNPKGLAIDGYGNIYESDYQGNAIYMVNSSGTTTLIAGNGTATESDNTTGTSATFHNPWGIAFDPAGYIYVSDYLGSTIRKISTMAPYAVTTLAGLSGVPTEVDGTGSSARFNHPTGIVYDGSTYLYVCDNAGNTIRRVNVSTGAVVTIAGSGSASEVDSSTGTSASFNGPIGITYDGSAYLYVTDNTGNTIRKINTTSPYAVSTFVASSAGLSAPQGLTIDASGYVEVADAGNNKVRTITPTGIVLTLAGDGVQNDYDAAGALAELYTPTAIVADYSGYLYVGDDRNASSSIRQIALLGYAIVPVLHTNLTFDTSTGAIAGAPNVYFSATPYTVTAFNASGSSSSVVTLSCGNSNNWLGTTNSVWAVASNWSRGTVPVSTDDVQIGVVTFTNQPIIDASTGNVNVNSITFGSAKATTLTVNNPETLTIPGYLTVNTGASATITGTGLVNMTPSSTVNVNGTGTLALTLSGGGLFTLQSDATGDASVGQITSTSITGTVTVQRYLTGGSLSYRGYRLLSSPVYNATDGNGNHIYSINYLKNSMYLTATTTNGGFDNTAAANPTLYIFRENMIPDYSTFTGSNFRAINNILSAPNYTLDIDGGPYNILAGDGYLCFFRGNRAAASFATETTPSYIPQTATLSTSGTLNAGQIIFRNWFTPTTTALSYSPSSPAGIMGHQLVGNPYASAIDWDTFQTTTPTQGMYGVNVTNTIYEYDEITKTYGTYIAGSGGVGSSSAMTNVISSGQGFFIVASSAGGQFIINESAKTTKHNTGITLLMTKQPVNMINNQYIRLQLMGKDSTVGDQTLIRFNNMATGKYTQGVDAAYMPGFGEASLSTKSSDMIDLSINNIPFPKQNARAVKLNFTVTNSGKYTISLRNLVQVPQLYDLWLIDAYKADSVNLRLNKTYSFNVNKADVASSGAKRFMLVIRENPALSYQLVNFGAKKGATTSRQVEVTWATKNEGNYTNFTVERSTDNGKTYLIIGSVKATGQGNYSFIDSAPADGTSLYRLQQEDINNAISYSKIVTIQYSNLSNQLAGGKINVYPNPANSTINLAISAASSATSAYRIRVMSTSGLVVKDIMSSQPTWQGNISDLKPGTYMIRVINNSTQDLVGENKFVKL
ncbi:T9SS type A sorting domain-containing protein [Mucilaginibacter sp. BT774]|uniref:T9SS type A sorting domain-containing protein n=1 Tax=Mucilaginibacter sp. BT774 TaxID=3062276 RepID=UPI002675E288|nr:T9SS type A sorting domain-containing protein [Mucilaginibacter sp. BT774]MDO3626981.1 T9SS type A sorting domain-containing protein [Mucilaginibacter sp. BT774]